ncbi:TonB-dependent siderophore receptor [Sphingomonas sp.]|uniref:TonB-dependent receptor plug domain-containing protein n=1 Tax=Sphingomonas sp. TaxID=28214 RepID=UPI0025E9F69D|nr:TonB-dependent receptor [Sphingomonas sp.]
MKPYAVSLLLMSGPALAQSAEDITVTAMRTPQRRSDVPVSMEIVPAELLDRTPGLTFIDQLKKTSGVDVIQYPNGLAGVGLRGFRPDFESSINPRTLTLVDGRPSGSTSFTTIAPESIDRIEVVKGPSSALYGASAEGGVVNIITRRSKGPIHGQIGGGYGSFDTLRGDGSIGGSITSSTDFDASLGYVDQRDDFKTAYGLTRPNSDFSRLSGRARVGADLASNVRFDASVDFARLNNSQPGPVSFSPQTPADTRLRRVGGDARLVVTPAHHRFQLVGYASREVYRYITIVPTTASSYQSSRTISRYRGVQAQDSWAIAPIFSLTYGFDWQRVELRPQSFSATSQVAPFSPNENRDSKAGFAEGTLLLLDGRIIVTAGARYDHIVSETLPTPLKTNFTGSRTSFNVWSPRGGAVFKLTPALRLHASAGSAFAPPQGSQTTGVTTEVAGRQTRVTTGNPDLAPERNTSFDMGMGYAAGPLYADLTYFHANTRNRIVSVITSETTALRQSTYRNADQSRVRGLEAAIGLDVGSLWGANPDQLTLRSDEVNAARLRASQRGPCWIQTAIAWSARPSDASEI